MIKDVIKRWIVFSYLLLRSILFMVCFILFFFLRRKKMPQVQVRKVLIIGLRRIGDNIVSLPVFRAIKEYYQNVKIIVLTNDYVEGILEEIEYIDEVIIPEEKKLLAILKTVRRLRQEKFDLAIDLTCDYTFKPVVWTYLSGATYRIGYNIWSRGFLFNIPIRPPKEPLHVIDEILNIVKVLGIYTHDKQPRLIPSEESQQAVNQFLKKWNVKDKDLLVGIHPGGYYPTQCWPCDKFARIADKLIEKCGVKIVLIGGTKDFRLIKQIETDMINKPIVFFNQPLRNLLALIYRCGLLICNNSGPLHIATAVETPTVSMMGPSLPHRWWPYGPGHVVIRKDLPCMPCNRGYCRLKTHRCMELITVEEVFEAAKDKLAQDKTDFGCSHGRHR